MTDLEFASETARSAGQLLLEHQTAPQNIRTKGYRDIVTDADIISQALITERLHSRFPQHAIWGEEGERPPSLNRPLWIIDPLDGTTNYAHGIPLFAVTLALLVEREVELGIVYAPSLDLMFTAERGQGAFMNGQPIQVGQETDVASAVVSCDWARSPENRKESLQMVHTVGEQVRTLRSSGAARAAQGKVER